MATKENLYDIVCELLKKGANVELKDAVSMHDNKLLNNDLFNVLGWMDSTYLGCLLWTYRNRKRIALFWRLSKCFGSEPPDTLNLGIW